MQDSRKNTKERISGASIMRRLTALALALFMTVTAVPMNAYAGNPVRTPKGATIVNKDNCRVYVGGLLGSFNPDNPTRIVYTGGDILVNVQYGDDRIPIDSFCSKEFSPNVQSGVTSELSWVSLTFSGSYTSTEPLKVYFQLIHTAQESMRIRRSGSDESISLSSTQPLFEKEYNGKTLDNNDLIDNSATQKSNLFIVSIDGDTLSYDEYGNVGRGYWITSDEKDVKDNAVFTIHLGSYYANQTVNLYYKIAKRDINKAAIGDIDAVTYNGEAQEPELAVKDSVPAADTSLVKDRDYTVAFTNNTNAGTATATLTGIGNYTGTKEKTFTINPKTIDASWITGIDNSYPYTGSSIKPNPTVKDGEKTLVRDTDYEVTYNANKDLGQNKGKVTIKGIGNYTGEVSKNFDITAGSLQEDDVTIKYNGVEIGTSSAPTGNPATTTIDAGTKMGLVYDGTAKTPELEVYKGTTKLTKPTHYTIAYDNNTNASSTGSPAKATITGAGSYVGSSIIVNFQIAKKPVSNEDIFYDEATNKAYLKITEERKVELFTVADNATYTGTVEMLGVSAECKKAANGTYTITVKVSSTAANFAYGTVSKTDVGTWGTRISTEVDNIKLFDPLEDTQLTQQGTVDVIHYAPDETAMIAIPKLVKDTTTLLTDIPGITVSYSKQTGFNVNDLITVTITADGTGTYIGSVTKYYKIVSTNLYTSYLNISAGSVKKSRAKDTAIEIELPNTGENITDVKSILSVELTDASYLKSRGVIPKNAYGFADNNGGTAFLKTDTSKVFLLTASGGNYTTSTSISVTLKWGKKDLGSSDVKVVYNESRFDNTVPILYDGETHTFSTSQELALYDESLGKTILSTDYTISQSVPSFSSGSCVVTFTATNDAATATYQKDSKKQVTVTISGESTEGYTVTMVDVHNPVTGKIVGNKTLKYAGNSTWGDIKFTAVKGTRTLSETTGVEKNKLTVEPSAEDRTVTPGTTQTLSLNSKFFNTPITWNVTIQALPFTYDNLNNSYYYTVPALSGWFGDGMITGNESTLNLTKRNEELYMGDLKFPTSGIEVKDVKGQTVGSVSVPSDLTSVGDHKIVFSAGSSHQQDELTIKVNVKGDLNGVTWSDDSDLLEKDYKESGYKVSDLGNMMLGTTPLILDTDYVISSIEKNGASLVTNATSSWVLKDVGEYTFKCSAKQGSKKYTGDFELKVQILYNLGLSSTQITFDPGNRVYYTGSAYTFIPTVKIGTKTLKATPDPAAAYSYRITGDTTNPGTVTVQFSSVEGVSKGTASRDIEILALPIDAGATLDVDTSAIEEMVFDPTYTEEKVKEKVGDKLKVRVKRNNNDAWISMTKDVDYEVSYPNLKKTSAGAPRAGRYQIRITGLGEKYSGAKILEHTFTIQKKPFSSATLTGNKVVFAGGSQAVYPTKIYDGAVLLDSYEYTDEMEAGLKTVDDTTDATIHASAEGDYTGTGSVDYQMDPLDLTSPEIKDSYFELSKVTSEYNGSEVNNINVKVYIPSGKDKVELPAMYYTVKYENSHDGKTYDKPCDGGSYSLKVTGTSNGGSVANTTRTVSNAYTVTPYQLKESDITLGTLSYDEVPDGGAEPTVSVHLNGGNTSIKSKCAVRYKDNQAPGANTDDSTNKPRVEVTGDGFSVSADTIAKYFQIGKHIKNVSGPSSVDRLYDGTAKIPTMAYSDGGRALIKDTHYTVTGDTNAVDAGTYSLLISAKAGNKKYYGSRVVTYIINKSTAEPTPVMEFTNMERDASMNYWCYYQNGAEIKPEFKVYTQVGGIRKDFEDTDFSGTPTYSNNKDSKLVSKKNATVSVTLKNYKNVVAGSFEIRAIDLNREKFEAVFAASGNEKLDKTLREYTGSEIKPTVNVRYTAETPASIKWNVSSANYDVTYSNNTTTGKATITVKGKNNFSGTLTLGFDIWAQIRPENVTIPDQMPTDESITKLYGVSVKIGGKTLVEGTDYKVEIKSDTVGPKGGYATITAVESDYLEGSCEKYFNIDLKNEMFLVYNFQSSVQYDGNDKKQNVDVVAVADTTRVLSQTQLDKTYTKTTGGTANDCVNVGRVKLSIKVKSGGKEVSLKDRFYNITARDISNESYCAIEPTTVSDVAYDGKAHKPELTLRNTGNGAIMSQNTDYIINYYNNVKPGTARIRVQGRGNFTGVRTVNFNVTMPNVTNVKAKATATNKIKVTWKKSTGNFSGYLIRYNVDGKTQKKVKVAKSKTSKTLTGLSAGKTYDIQVSTYYKKVGGQPEVYGNTSVVTQDTKPSKAKNVKAKAQSGRKIKLTWSKVSGASGYMIYRKTGSGKYKRIKTITSGSTVSYTNTGLTKGTKYTYRVLAYRLNGTKRTYSAYSDPSSAKAKK